MNSFLQTLRGLGPVKLGAIGLVLLGVLGFFGYMASRMSEVGMSLLYADLDLTEGGQIAAKLDELGVPYELRGGGSSVMVPSDQVDRLRLTMAEEGLPSDGSIGYEIFDQTSSLGTTSFVQNINKLRALEGELARTIATIAGIQQARVHLVLPERELFSREEQEPSASVFLRLRGPGLGGQQILAIQQLVASAVPRLEARHIAIVDDRGNLLAGAEDGSAEDMALMNATSMQSEYEKRLARTIEELLSRSVGFGKVRAQVSAEMDFDRVTTTAESYDPDSQVARSTQVTQEESSDQDSDAPVSVSENLPEAGASPAPEGGSTTSNSSRSEEITNFEINRTVENTVRQAGTVRRLSVAVLVDGTYAAAEDGTSQYVPRPDAEMAQLDTLVRSAIGFDAARGDTVEVINMPFAPADDAEFAPVEEPFLGMEKEDWFRVGEMATLAVVGLLVLLLVVRPIVMRLLDNGRAAALPAADEVGLLPAPAGAALAALPAPPGALVPVGAEAPTALDALVNLDKVEGRVRESSLRKVGDVVQKYPEQAVTILRTWMAQQG